MRLYRLLLHCYPRSFRAAYGAELCALFARRLREAAHPAARIVRRDRRAGGRAAQRRRRSPRFARSGPATHRAIARAGARLHADGNRRVGAGRRGHDRRVLDRRSRAPPSAAVSRIRPPRPALAGPVVSRLSAHGTVAQQLPRLAAPGDVVRRDGCVHVAFGQSGRAGRSGAARGHDDHARRVPGVAGACRARTDADQHRRAGIERANGRPQSAHLADEVRRRSFGARANHHAERHAPRDRRRSCPPASSSPVAASITGCRSDSRRRWWPTAPTRISTSWPGSRTGSRSNRHAPRCGWWPRSSRAPIPRTTRRPAPPSTCCAIGWDGRRGCCCSGSSARRCARCSSRARTCRICCWPAG